jgi:hypothetical protein
MMACPLIHEAAYLKNKQFSTPNTIPTAVDTMPNMMNWARIKNGVYASKDCPYK